MPVNKQHTAISSRINLVLVGGTGYVGNEIINYIADYLPEEIKIKALVRGDGNRLQNKKTPKLEVVSGALPHVPRNLFFDSPFILIHFGTKQIDRDGTGFDQINVEGTRQLLACAGPGLLGVIYGSSMSVYGQGTQSGISEDTPANPGTALAHSRLKAENVIRAATRQRGKSAFLLRPRFILGKNDRHTLPGLIKLYRKRIRIGSGSQSYSIIDAEDYARIVVQIAKRIIQRNETGNHVRKAVNIGYEKTISFNEINRVFAEYSSLPAPFIQMPVWMSKIFRKIPHRACRSLATKIELIGRDHSGSVKTLEKEIGSKIIGKNPDMILRKIIEQAGLSTNLQAGK